jgi:hypothetical protein
MLEAAMEHGGHNFLRIPFTLAEGVQEIEQAGEEELGPVRLSIQLNLPD